jgi:hypothetical protein
LVEELIMPCVERIKRLVHIDIINKHTAICPSVECDTQTLEPLLPRGVPDLETKEAQMIRTVDYVFTEKEHQLFTCNVTSLSSIRTSLVTKSAPIVALYC